MKLLALLDVLVPVTFMFVGTGLALGWQWAGALLGTIGLFWGAAWAFARLVADKREPEL